MGNFETSAAASAQGERCHSGIVGEYFQIRVSAMWSRGCGWYVCLHTETKGRKVDETRRGTDDRVLLLAGQ